jgi:hypothetical protein
MPIGTVVHRFLLNFHLKQGILLFTGFKPGLLCYSETLQ